jgi:hypothetical protein
MINYQKKFEQKYNYPDDINCRICTGCCSIKEECFLDYLEKQLKIKDELIENIEKWKNSTDKSIDAYKLIQSYNKYRIEIEK